MQCRARKRSGGVGRGVIGASRCEMQSSIVASKSQTIQKEELRPKVRMTRAVRAKVEAVKQVPTEIHFYDRAVG